MEKWIYSNCCIARKFLFISQLNSSNFAINKFTSYLRFAIRDSRFAIRDNREIENSLLHLFNFLKQKYFLIERRGVHDTRVQNTALGHVPVQTLLHARLNFTSEIISRLEIPRDDRVVFYQKEIHIRMLTRGSLG